MPRGRQYVPPIDRDGIWFRHTEERTLPNLNREDLTSTGRMFTGALKPNTKTFPIPSPFQMRGARNYKRSNEFSCHNNRHELQDCGEYFQDDKGQRSLGKRSLSVVERQHCTPKDMLKHFDGGATDFDYNTTYRVTHRGTSSNNITANRRYPKQHSSGTGPAKPANTISDWFPHVNEHLQIPLQVLASSQEPFPRHNAWKYSQNSLHEVYPSYRVSGPLPRPIFNKYGANFLRGTTSS